MVLDAFAHVEMTALNVLHLLMVFGIVRAYMPPWRTFFHSENLHSPIRPSDRRSRGGVKIEISESNRSTAPRPLPFSDPRIPMSLLDFCTKPSSYTTGPGVSVVRKSWLGGQVHSLRSPFSDLQSISRPAPGRSAGSAGAQGCRSVIPGAHQRIASGSMA